MAVNKRMSRVDAEVQKALAGIISKFDDIDYFITDAELDEKMCETLEASKVVVEKI